MPGRVLMPGPQRGQVGRKIVPEVYANRLGSHEESQTQNCRFYGSLLLCSTKKEQEASHGLTSLSLQLPTP